MRLARRASSTIVPFNPREEISHVVVGKPCTKAQIGGFRPVGHRGGRPRLESIESESKCLVDHDLERFAKGSGILLCPLRDIGIKRQWGSHKDISMPVLGRVKLHPNR